MCIVDREAVLASVWWFLAFGNPRSQKKPQTSRNKRVKISFDNQLTINRWLGCTCPSGPKFAARLPSGRMSTFYGPFLRIDVLAPVRRNPKNSSQTPSMVDAGAKPRGSTCQFRLASNCGSLFRRHRKEVSQTVEWSFRWLRGANTMNLMGNELWIISSQLDVIREKFTSPGDSEEDTAEARLDETMWRRIV